MSGAPRDTFDRGTGAAGDAVAEIRPQDFRRLFESCVASVLVMDPDLRIVAVTDAYLSDTMTVREEILGRDVFDVFPEDKDDIARGGSVPRISFGRVRDTLQPDSPGVLRYDIPLPGGRGFTERYWNPFNYPLLNDDGSLRYIVHTVVDVTEAVTARNRATESAAEAASMRARAEELDLAVSAASRDLARANEQLRSASRAKDEFLSQMSHELRTPLNSVIGFADLMRRDKLTADQHESIDQILKAGHLLLDLINEILDISRITSGRLSLSSEPVSVAAVIDDAVALIGPAAVSAGIEVMIDEANGLHVQADSQRLQQVLLNLLSNAVKYNRRGGSVQIGRELGPPGRLLIHVADDGPGIPAERLEEIWLPFHRLDEAGGIEGSGLGLPLSRGLAEAMGGTISVSSEAGRGSTFTVELALADSPEQVLEPRIDRTRGRARLAPARVLYIEDNVSNVRLIQRILGDHEGLEVQSAMLGRLGLDLARQHHPDLVLLDLHLPDCSGEEVLAELQADPSTASIPVVVMSADATGGRIERLLASGASQYITKPFDIDEFLDIVDDLLSTGPATGDAPMGGEEDP